MIKYQIIEYENEKDCWLNKMSWCRNFYSANALKECFASRIEDHDILISYLGLKDVPNVLKHVGLFNKFIAFVDKSTRKTYQFKKVEETFKYRIEDIAECIIRICDENDIFLSPRDVILYCHYIKRWYKEHGIDIMHEDIENRGGFPRNKRLEDKIGDSFLIFSYVKHFEKDGEKYFKAPLKDEVKYTPLKQEDEKIVFDLLNVLTKTSVYELLDQFRKDEKCII